MWKRLVLGLTLSISVPAAARPTEAREARSPANVSERLQHALRVNAFHAILPMLDFDATVTMPGRAIGEIPFAGSYRGWPEIAALLEAMADTLDVQSVGFQYQIGEGDEIITHLDVTARVIPTGKIARLEWALMMRFDGTNRIASLRVFYDTWSLWKAFQPGGDVVVTDLRPIPNDFRVWPVSFDTGAALAQAYDAFFFAGDVGSVLAIFNDASIWCLKGSPDLPWYGYYVGAAGFLQFVYNMLSHSVYAYPPADINAIVAQGNRAEGFITEHQVNPVTGGLANIDILQAFEFADDGTLIQFDSFNDSYELYRTFVVPGQN